MRKLLLLVTVFFAMSAWGFSASQLEGSHRPYPITNSIIEYPDSLKPFYISYIGRHGSRYPSSASTTIFVKSYLERADTLGSLTKKGKQLLEVINDVITLSNDKWGELSPIGIGEQRGIAERMFGKYPEVFNEGCLVEAVSSQSSGAVMSMYAFTHRLVQLFNKIEVTTSESSRYVPMLRPFDESEKYFTFRSSREWRDVYKQYYETECPVDVARRLVGYNFAATEDELRELSFNIYSLIAGMSAMDLDIDFTHYINEDEYEKMWSIANLRHYLLYSATTISTIPAELAIPLIEDIVNAADRVVEGRRSVAANLRFANAETLMPLLSLLQIDGCYYLTHYFDQVGNNWHDFDIVPMSANLQFVFFKAESGGIYVLTELNERPITLIPGNDDIYLPWETVRNYLLNFILVVE